MANSLAWILGDSHVFRLERFVASAEIRVESGTLVECTDCRIGFEGFHDATVASLQRHRGVYRKLAASLPNIVVLSVGGNDLDTAGGPGTLEVGRRMCEYAQALVGRGVMKVLICQFVRRQS